jgi:hypothetical protein
MRVLLAIAILVCALAGVPRATAADLGIGARPVMSGDYYLFADRAGALIVYDFEPGIVQRAYYLPPWRDRHYFPFHAVRPRHSQAPAGRPRPAESYFRYWSNDGAFIDDLPPQALRSFDTPPTPRRRPHAATPPRKNDDVKSDENSE